MTRNTHRLNSVDVDEDEQNHQPSWTRYEVGVVGHTHVVIDLLVVNTEIGIAEVRQKIDHASHSS